MVNVLKSSATRQEARVDRCHRCGGLMVQERVFEIGSVDWRCVSCGERIDPVILAHRQVHRPKRLAREEAEKLFIGHGKPRLN
jgi:tRNA(Ile2) C34 agmatinyltransferase TiaS